MRFAAALALALLGCEQEDSERHTYDVPLPSADAGIQFRADTCRVDVDACRALCATVDRAHRGATSGTLTTCEVGFTPQGALVTVEFTTFFLD